MVLPTVHLNGTSKQSLLNDLMVASEALDTAYNELRKCVPNGRDYYPQGDGALETATNEFLIRLGRVSSVKKEIDQMILAIDRM